MTSIRRYLPEDGSPVKHLISGIMNGEFSDAKTAYPTDDLEDIPHSYGGIGEAFFVAVNGNKIIGTVGIKKEDERVALMRRLFVASPYRRQQIGLKLIDRALQFCNEVGYQEVIFKTTSNMEGAIRACEKKGFVQRAKIKLRGVELMKFAFFIRNGLGRSKN